MPLRINGSTISWTAVSTLFIAIFWLAGLSFQVRANDADIEKLAETRERLTRIETKQEDQKEDIEEIKEEQKEQSLLLHEILKQVSKNDDDQS